MGQEALHILFLDLSSFLLLDKWKLSMLEKQLVNLLGVVMREERGKILFGELMEKF